MRKHVLKSSLLCAAWLLVSATAGADWRSQFDADRFSARMDELYRAEQRSTAGIIAGAQADMARQTAGYYARISAERDARYAAFQRAMAQAEAAERSAREQARSQAAAQPAPPSGYDLLQRMEAEARSGKPGLARTLGDAYREGVGVVERDAAKAASWYALAAQAGDAAAASTLGAMYALGQGVAKDDAAAFRYTLQAAQGGDETALGNAGSMYEFGIGTVRDDAQAVRWYRQAAEQGSVRGASGYGRALLIGKGGLSANAPEAMTYLRKAANAGDSAAQMFAAQTLITGSGGVARDPQQALRWYASAARDFPALYGDLASLYANGSQYGVAPDSAKVLEYAREGAQAGDGQASYLLADAYFNGRGVAADDALGRQWIAKSAEAGDAQGTYSYALCLLRGIGGTADVPQGERLLFKAAEAGVAKAQYEAAVMLFQGGQTVQRDVPRGVKLMLAAAEAGHADAQANVADFRAVGELLPADPVAARDWARRSAEQGSQMGLINYGDFLLRGVGGAANPQGAALLEKAVALGEPYGGHAALTLGQYYRDGRYLPRDPALALRWLQQARAMGHPEADQELATLH
jgi:TPR repeat protein